MADENATGGDVERTRSEYRLALPIEDGGGRLDPEQLGAVRPLGVDDREAVALLLLDAYRGTIDDEGETIVEAREAAEFLIDDAELAHSWIIDDAAHPDGRAVAVCIVNSIDGVHYVNLIAVAAASKQLGLGRSLTCHALARLHETGCDEVGAAITDGNVASERLFASLGASRIGPWPPTP